MGSSGPAVEDRALNVSWHLQKPFRAEGLLEAIRRLGGEGDAGGERGDRRWRRLVPLLGDALGWGMRSAAPIADRMGSFRPIGPKRPGPSALFGWRLTMNSSDAHDTVLVSARVAFGGPPGKVMGIGQSGEDGSKREHQRRSA